MRILFACLVTLVASVGAAVEPASAAAVKLQTPLCHLDAATGVHTLVYSSGKALSKHQEHGDVGPGDPVPGSDGYVFDDSCTPVSVVQQTCEGFGATFAVGADPVLWSCGPISLIQSVPLNDLCRAAGGQPVWQEWDRRTICSVGYV